MNAFSAHPVTTWKIIQANLIPYQTRLGTKGSYYQKLLDEIGAAFQKRVYRSTIERKIFIGLLQSAV